MVISATPMSYVGGDIVGPLIHGNTARYATPNISFEILDILTDDLPKADIWFCRDVLFHFPNSAVSTILNRFLKSQIRFLITTHFEDTAVNKDISFGEYSPLNICREPFNWPKPISILRDHDANDPDRCMGVWLNPRLSPLLADRMAASAGEMVPS
jgi:hypothetical protein